MTGIVDKVGEQSGVIGASALPNGVSAAGGQQSFMIYDGDFWTVANGGCCLAWTVPAGTQIITFEVVSGGGPGGSAAHDHDVGSGGSGGNYNSKTLCAGASHFTPGSTVYTLCAGGSSLCSCCLSCNMNCRHGYPSFVTGTGLTNFCAMGGTGGSTSWDVMSNCYNCHMGNSQCSRGQVNQGWVSYICQNNAYGGDTRMNFKGGTAGMYAGYDCCMMIQTATGSPTGPFTAPWGGGGRMYCYGNVACCSSNSLFPGGGGPGNGSASTTPCTGGFGNGGLVKVSYQ